MIRVLIVDDDRFARMGLMSMIPWEKYGMQIVGEAANGKRALEFLGRNKVNLMFVDIAMPIMDGIQLIQRVKAAFPDVHFVLLTFHEEFEYVQEALRLGALDYISKDKLEMEDYDRIMDRICKRIVSDGEAGTELDNEHLKKLEQLLDGILWLYDNYRMERVLRLLERSNIPMRSLEKLLAAVMGRIGADTQLKLPQVPRLESAEMAAEYLQDCRNQYREGVLQQADTVYARLMMAAVYMQAHYSEQIRASEVARAVNYSRSYFSVSFKKVLGITMNTYVRRERVRSAMRLLKNTALSQSEIARRCGYSDVSNFKNAFREVAGCFPGKYREKCSEKRE